MSKGNCHGAVSKLSSEQHFHKSATITLLCEISVALHLCNQVLRQAGWLADEI